MKSKCILHTFFVCVWFLADEMGKHAQSMVINEPILAVWPGSVQREVPSFSSAAVKLFNIGIKKINE